MFLETIVSIHQVSTFVFLVAVRENTIWGRLGERLGNYSTGFGDFTMKIVEIAGQTTTATVLSETICVYVCMSVCTYACMRGPVRHGEALRSPVYT